MRQKFETLYGDSDDMEVLPVIDIPRSRQSGEFDAPTAPYLSPFEADIIQRGNDLIADVLGEPQVTRIESRVKPEIVTAEDLAGIAISLWETDHISPETFLMVKDDPIHAKAYELIPHEQHTFPKLGLVG